MGQARKNPRPTQAYRIGAWIASSSYETVFVFFRKKSIRMNWPSVIVFVK